MKLARLAAELGIGAPAAAVLYGRGIRNSVQARAFLHPRLESLHSPHLLLGMDAALDRLRRAIRDRERILIYGDYDVDGTTSVVILKTAIELAGGIADFHVPHRFRKAMACVPEVMEQRRARKYPAHRQRRYRDSRHRGGEARGRA